MCLLDLQNNLNSIDPWEILKPILEDNINLFIDANIFQLEKGQKNDGSLLNRYKSVVYLNFKRSLATYSAPGGAADLRLTGDFYDGFFGDVDDKGILLGSTDWKDSILTSNYGSDIWGVQDKALTEIMNSHIIPEFQEKLLIRMLEY